MGVPGDLMQVGSVQVRQSLHVQDVDDDKGEIYGRVIPFEKVVELMRGLSEVLERDAFGSQPSAVDHYARVQLRWAHATDEVPLGRATHLEALNDGLYGRWRFNNELRTAEGTRAWQVWQSIKSGDMTELSAGFRVKREPIITEVDGGLLITRQRDSCHLVEGSIVPSGAYGQDAVLLAVRDTRQAWRDGWAARIARLR